MHLHVQGGKNDKNNQLNGHTSETFVFAFIYVSFVHKIPATMTLIAFYFHAAGRDGYIVQLSLADASHTVHIVSRLFDALRPLQNCILLVNLCGHSVHLHVHGGKMTKIIS